MLELDGIEAQIAAEEAQVPGLRPGCARRIVWSGDPAVKTSVAVLYIHGFSASPEELRPLPDLVGKGLGANLYFTRLTGHGQDGAAMATATLDAWRQDVADAVAVVCALGDEVILMGCSTGCTLATLALAEGLEAKAVIHVSPNFGLRNRAAQFVMDMPFAQHWAHLLAGKTRSYEVISEAHAAYWTTEYPTAAVHPMGDAVRAVHRVDLGQVKVPAFFAYNPADQVVHEADTRKVIARWGGPVTTLLLEQGPDDDLMGHVMAGDIFSPRQTEPLAEKILAWVKSA
ncbi:alpha/beta fold hydrolase [Cognatiyoonia sp. IB215446]|uniref:alpha/beta hydrolase n=1 Tax=Cognatiyoonia sp. IB215446 TaxID=3097355 RepID=UPI002A17CACC|nr:alpha/beta fold hydrolase [Cognatiyoonia sp. IB215446]MDX8348257.1 alpha/beta fold hydrolase [Cognatiyoonia sp. IB215446]